MEADILQDGRIDFDEAALARLDFVIASIHSRFNMGEREMTTRMLAAMDNPHVTIIGHPTGRLLLSRDPYGLDIDAVMEKAAATGVALEVNADPHRLDLDWRSLRRAHERGVTISIGATRSVAGIENVEFGVGMARKGWIGPEEVLNAQPIEPFPGTFGPEARGLRRAARYAAEARARRATLTFRRLSRAYPDAQTALNHRNVFELLCATILSAQCTDARVNLVTPHLFARFPTPEALAVASRGEVEEIIKSTGFFRNKSKSLVGMAQALVADHGGEVPRSMEELRTLPGVGRKTANVILGNAFGINEGITVDTHVARLSQRLGFTREEDPVKIERDLMPLFPRKNWALLSHLLIFHGRQVCLARRPRCAGCVLNDICPSSLV